MLNKSKIINLVREALKEDIGSGDITTNSLIPKELKIKAVILSKEDGVICGLEVAEMVFNLLDQKVRFLPAVKDGAQISKGQEVAYLEGSAKGILTGERTALNFLSRLSGISTLTNQFVEKVANYKAKIFDTRKTTPNLRYLEKYAVKTGGGFNHRFGLYDQVLIKENHLSVLNKGNIIPQVINLARKKVQKNIKIEIEVQNLEEFNQALKSQPDIIMLDNMNEEEIKEAVKIRDKSLPYKDRKDYPVDKSGINLFIEVSGGVNLENVEKIASTGVDIISVGALTHSAKSLDFSLDVIGNE